MNASDALEIAPTVPQSKTLSEVRSDGLAEIARIVPNTPEVVVRLGLIVVPRIVAHAIG
jgi:hypothetical protein